MEKGIKFREHLTFLRWHYPDQVSGYNLSLLVKAPRVVYLGKDSFVSTNWQAFLGLEAGNC
jgi:hypothetical protein